MNRFVIFLDIDGVLNGEEQFTTGINFSKESVLTLKRLVKKNNTEIVLTTSWQGIGEKKTREKIVKIFNNINIHINDFINPNLDGKLLDKTISNRVCGIIDYLKNNQNINYVILDDEYQNQYKLFKLNYYKTNTYIGLRKKDLNRIKFSNKIPNTINYLDYYEDKVYKKNQIKKLCLAIKNIKK